MSLLCLGLFALQMDKGNISNALTSTFTEDLGISTDDVNNGNQLQLAAIVVFEIPFNVVLSKVGGQVLLTSQSLAWGLVALFQAFITNKSSFYGTRFLLGAFEAGYLPGAMVVMSSFYTRSEIAMRMTILYSGNYLAAGVSSLVAAGVFELAGVRGLAGWQVCLFHSSPSPKLCLFISGIMRLVLIRMQPVAVHHRRSFYCPGDRGLFLLPSRVPEAHLAFMSHQGIRLFHRTGSPHLEPAHCT